MRTLKEFLAGKSIEFLFDSIHVSDPDKVYLILLTHLNKVIRASELVFVIYGKDKSLANTKSYKKDMLRIQKIISYLRVRRELNIQSDHRYIDIGFKLVSEDK